MLIVAVESRRVPQGDFRDFSEVQIKACKRVFRNRAAVRTHGPADATLQEPILKDGLRGDNSPLSG